jgi:hypothetical protein
VLSIVEIPIVFFCLNILVSLKFMLEVCYLNVLVFMMSLKHVVQLQLIIKLNAQVLFAFVHVRCFQTLSINISIAQRLSLCFASSLPTSSGRKISTMFLYVFFKFTCPTFALFTNCSCTFLSSLSIVVEHYL